MPTTLTFNGSPLIPLELITLYLLFFTSSLGLLYAVVHRRFKPERLHHHLGLLVLTTITLKVLLIASLCLLLAFWFIPQPRIVSLSPATGSINNSTREPLTIAFNHPVDRQTLEKHITPDTPGLWTFADPVYGTHLYRTLVFYPSFSLDPNTTYTISLDRITNFAQISSAYNFTTSFTTEASPQITSLSPSPDTPIEITSPITIQLDKPNRELSQFDYQITPQVDFNFVTDHTNSFYLLTPTSPLQQGTTYHLQIFQTNLTWDLTSQTISKRNPTSIAYQTSFTTKEAPGITSLTPTGVNVLPTTPIVIKFTQPMDHQSVETHFAIQPNSSGSYTWETDTHVTFHPTSLAFDTDYTVSLISGAKTQHSGFLESTTTKKFTTIGPVRIAHAYPAHLWTAVDPTNPIQVTFDQQVDPTSAQERFSLFPSTPGSFSWHENTLTFTPEKPLAYNTSYTLTLNPGIPSTEGGLASTRSFSASFSTQNATVKLLVPSYLQKYTLSCEIASLRMALAYRQVLVDEDTLLQQIGLDTTPHQGNVWGDPYKAFVGNVRGRQMYDGYGVYWGPIADTARLYRQASSFEGGDISTITSALLADNPVIVWVYSQNGSPTQWFTLDGRQIFAARGEHAVVASGFVGAASNPTHIIVNDPLTGVVYWPRSLFDTKWLTFNRSGVILY